MGGQSADLAMEPFSGALAAAAAAKSLQLCLTLCAPIDGSPSGSTVPGILQARTLERALAQIFKSWSGTTGAQLLKLGQQINTK